MSRSRSGRFRSKQGFERESKSRKFKKCRKEKRKKRHISSSISTTSSFLVIVGPPRIKKNLVETLESKVVGMR